MDILMTYWSSLWHNVMKEIEQTRLSHTVQEREAFERARNRRDGRTWGAFAQTRRKAAPPYERRRLLP